VFILEAHERYAKQQTAFPVKEDEKSVEPD
jgi:hypothetical protein